MVYPRLREGRRGSGQRWLKVGAVMIPLAIPNLAGRESQYLQECVSTNFVSSVGPFVDRFEKELAQKVGANFAVSTSSGTTALHLALTVLGVRHNDLVILPSFTFIASANSISHCGAMPWLFDVDEGSWTISVAQLERVLEEKTKIESGRVIHKITGQRVAAIMPVYTLGTAPEMSAIRKVADKYKLPVIADAAAALGATYHHEQLGDLADLTAFSFNGNKIITSGGGGMIVGNNEALMKRAKHLCTTARVSEDYLHDEVGFNYRMTNVGAALGCAQLELLDKFLNKKREIARKYRAAFLNLNDVSCFPMPAWSESACWFSGVVLGKKWEVKKVCEQLKVKGIAARPFWMPIHLQPPYAHALRESLSTTESFWRGILTLPCSTSLTEKDQDYVIHTLQNILRET